MASNPITIGELTDVPAPNSAINAQFHQEVANRIAHRFATVALMNGWAAGNGSLAYAADTNSIYSRQSGAWVALASAASVTTVQNNLNTTNANLATAPLGMLQRVAGTEFLGVSNATEICRVTFTATPGRWYRTEAFIGTLRAGNGDVEALASIWDSGTTPLITAREYLVLNRTTAVTLPLVEQNLNGSIVRRLVVSRLSGTGVIDVFAGGIAGIVPFITLEDLGAV